MYSCYRWCNRHRINNCVFKPLVTGSYIALNGEPVCTYLHDHLYLSFVLDSVFCLTITFISVVLITVLNLLIIRKLAITNQRQQKIQLVTEESIIKLEFMFILLAISICFVIWCKRHWIFKRMFDTNAYSPSWLQAHNGDVMELNQKLHVTRSVFYSNYCINFFCTPSREHISANNCCTFSITKSMHIWTIVIIRLTVLRSLYSTPHEWM